MRGDELAEKLVEAIFEDWQTPDEVIHDVREALEGKVVVDEAEMRELLDKKLAYCQTMNPHWTNLSVIILLTELKKHILGTDMNEGRRCEELGS
jgi:23S rRNA U2552 (ribose-2'-O)-methylase RlmE/FtsJ